MDHTLSDTTPTTNDFNDLCDLLALGRVEFVSGQLDTVALSPTQTTYLRAWLWSKDKAHWDAAAGILEQALPEAAAPYRELVYDCTPRRKRPWVQWLLGRLASSLGRNVFEHYKWGIVLLDQRRMNVDWLRILLLAEIAQELARRGEEQTALEIYTDALERCTQEQELHLAHPQICAGLCHLYSKQEATRDLALTYGKQALALFPETARSSRARVLSRLAGLTPSQEAFTLYREAEALTDKGELRGRIALACAQRRYQEGEMETARNDGLRALEEITLSSTLRAEASMLLARLEMDAQRSEEAIAWCLKACDASASPQTLKTLATILEEILELDLQQALSPSWRQAYHFLVKRR